MKALKLFALLALAGGAMACEPGQIAGPNTAKVTMVFSMENMVCDDVLIPSADGENLEPSLTLKDPQERYRVRVQTYEYTRFTSNGVEYGGVPVGLYSTRRQRLTVRKVSVRTDQATLIVFHERDFGIPTNPAKPCG